MTGPASAHERPRRVATFTATWPAFTIAAVVGAFCLVAAVWTVFGIPGVLFALSAVSHANRCDVRSIWVSVGGSAAGLVALLGIGAVIG